MKIHPGSFPGDADRTYSLKYSLTLMLTFSSYDHSKEEKKHISFNVNVGMHWLRTKAMT